MFGWKGDHLFFSFLKNLFLSEACIPLSHISVCFSLGLGGLGEAWFPSPWFCGGCGGECGQTCLVCLLVTPPPSNNSCRRANNLETLCLIPGGLYLRNLSWFSSGPVSLEMWPQTTSWDGQSTSWGV